VVWFAKLQQWALFVGLCAAAVLLVRFALDMTEGASLYLAAPFWLLVIAALSVSAASILSRKREAPDRPSRRESGILLAAIPLGFIASSLDCSGLDLEGCSRFCTFFKLAWIPLITITSLAYYMILRRESRIPSQEREPPGVTQNVVALALIAMSFVALVPHCVCYNAGNGWWIDRIGASPTCYAWGFAASVVSLGALYRGSNLLPSIVVNLAIILGAFTFFISHHYFHWPG
jgi:hypothetical protein